MAGFNDSNLLVKSIVWVRTLYFEDPEDNQQLSIVLLEAKRVYSPLAEVVMLEIGCNAVGRIIVKTHE